MKYPTFEACRKRIEQLLQEPRFVQMAKDFLANRKTYKEEMALCNDVLSTGYGKFSIDESKLHGDFFDDKEMIEIMIHFYRHLDTLAGEDNSLEFRAIDNMKYLKFIHDPKYRSNCGRNGVDRHINIGVQRLIRDAGNLVHEMGHSQSEHFYLSKDLKDEKMREFSTVIIDQIFSEFLKTERPELAENLVYGFAETQLVNKSKAKQSILEARFVEMMAGRISLDDAFNECIRLYGNLGPAGQLLESVDRALSPNATSDDELKPLYETRYLFPQMMAVYAREQYLKNPEDFAKKFKYVLQHDCALTEEEALKAIGFPEREKIIQWYKDNIAHKIEDQFDLLENEDDAENEQ